MRRSFQEISHKDNKILPGSDSGPVIPDPSAGVGVGVEVGVGGRGGGGGGTASRATAALMDRRLALSPRIL